MAAVAAQLRRLAIIRVQVDCTRLVQDCWLPLHHSMNNGETRNSSDDNNSSLNYNGNTEIIKKCMWQKPQVAFGLLGMKTIWSPLCPDLKICRGSAQLTPHRFRIKMVQGLRFKAWGYHKLTGPFLSSTANNP